MTAPEMSYVMVIIIIVIIILDPGTSFPGCETLSKVYWCLHGTATMGTRKL